MGRCSPPATRPGRSLAWLRWGGSLRAQPRTARGSVWRAGRERVKELREVIMFLIFLCDLIKM